MEKLVYLSWRKSPLAIEAYRERLLGSLAPRLIDAGALKLDLNVSDVIGTIQRPMLLMGEGASLSAAISLWLDCYDTRGPLETILAEDADRLSGYLVTESVPQAAADRDWPDGVRSPGVSHFTWFEKPKELPDEAFFQAWHEVHTPFSFELHPRRWSYVRNSVLRTLTPGAPPVRAIVVERFRSLEDYTDPKRLFGSPEVLKRTAEEVSAYADPASLNSVPLSEYILRS
jgi:hypothetical protein